MPKTVMSTTTIEWPNGESSFGYEPCPIRPSNFKGDEGSTPSWAVGITCANGERIYWHECDVTKHCMDGRLITWFNKPTICDAIQMTKVRKGEYYRFYPDGSVEVKYEMDTRTYHWSEEVDGVEEEGAIIWYHFNEYKELYVENIEPVPCKNCSGDSRGSYNEAWEFCSDECFSEHNMKNP